LMNIKLFFVANTFGKSSAVAARCLGDKKLI